MASAAAAMPWSGAFSPVATAETARQANSPVFSVGSGASPTSAGDDDPKAPLANVKRLHELASGKHVAWADQQPKRPPAAEVAEEGSESDEEELLFPPAGAEKEKAGADAGADAGGARVRQRALSLRAKRLPAVPYISIHSSGDAVPRSASAPLASATTGSSEAPPAARTRSEGSGRASAVDLIYGAAARPATALEAESATVIKELLAETEGILAEKQALEQRLAEMELAEVQRRLEPAPWRTLRTGSRRSPQPAATAERSTNSASARTSSAPSKATTKSTAPLRGAVGGGVERVSNAARLVSRVKKLQASRSSSASSSADTSARRAADRSWASAPPSSPPLSAAASTAAVGRSKSAPAGTAPLTARAKQLAAQRKQRAAAKTQEQEKDAEKGKAKEGVGGVRLSGRDVKIDWAL